jgi:hypothetical protein
MSIPGESPDFELPEDEGEKLAWVKKHVEALPGLAERLGLTPEQVAKARAGYEGMRALQDAVDKALLNLIAAKLSRVPDGEPQRQRMLEELDRWCAAVVWAGSPHAAPKLSGGWFVDGLVLRVTPPEPCRWWRISYRPAGQVPWRFLAIMRKDHYYLTTDPAEEAEGEEKLTGRLEFTAIGLLPREDLQARIGDEWGAPSAVLTLTVPQEYPVPEALWDKGGSGS